MRYIRTLNVMIWYNENLMVLRGSVYFADGKDMNILLGKWTVAIDYKTSPMLESSLCSFLLCSSSYNVVQFTFLHFESYLDLALAFAKVM